MTDQEFQQTVQDMRRLARVQIAAQFLASVLTLREIDADRVDGLPEDAVVVDAKFIPQAGTLEVTLMSRYFNPLVMGQEPPLITPIYHRDPPEPMAQTA